MAAIVVKRARTFKRVLRWTAKVLGLLLVSAFSVPLWQYILRPLIGHTRDWVLDFATLGVQRYKDNIYAEVARGFRESLDMATFIFLVMFIIIGIMFSLSWVFLRLRSALDDYTELLDRKDTPGGQEVESRRSSDEFKKEVAHYVRGRKKDWYVQIALAMIILAILFLGSVQELYVNSAVSHFQQVLRIASPYLDDGEEKFILSEFAQIQNKEDYVRIVERLVSTARMNGQEIPTFDPW